MAKAGNVDRCFSLPRGVFLDCYNLYPRSKLNIKVECDETYTGIKTELHFQAIDENTIVILIKEADKDNENSNGSEHDSSGSRKLISIDSFKVKKEVEDGSDIEGAASVLGGICTELVGIDTNEKTENENFSQGRFEDKEFLLSANMNDDLDEVISNYLSESDGEKMATDESYSSDETVVITTKKDQDRPKKSKKVVKRKSTNVNSSKSKSIKCVVKKEKSQTSDDRIKKDKPFHCDHCRKCFKMEFSLYKHVKDHHNITLAYLDNVQDADTSLECPYCHVMFMSFNSLKYHINYEHSVIEQDSYIHKCTLCDAVLKTTKNLLGHIELVHNLTKRKFLCHICGSAFKTEFVHQQHVTNVHGNPEEQVLKCEICSYTTRSKKYFTDHMSQIHGPKKFMCTVCSRQFKLKRDLNRHILFIHETHKIVKKVCDLCGKQFNSKSNLNSHRRRSHKFSVTTTATLPNKLNLISEDINSLVTTGSLSNELGVTSEDNKSLVSLPNEINLETFGDK